MEQWIYQMIEKTIDDQLEFRYYNLEEDTNDKWLWIKSDGGPDGGAWMGPIKDWSSHSVEYFKNVKKYDTVITAGANLGLYARMYAKRFKKVYAFEPEWLNFHCMSYNNPYENVIKFQAALGHEHTFCSMRRPTDLNVGMHHINELNTGTIPVVTIDSFNFQECDLIQLDVEGFEYPALIGAQKTIQKFKPVLVVERPSEDVLKFMKHYNYELQAKSGHADAVFIPT